MTLSVTPDASTPDSDALFEAAIAAAQGPPPDPAATTPTGDSAPPKPAEPAASPAEVTPPAPAPVAPEPAKFAPQLLKLMEREAQIVEREGKLKVTESELAKTKDSVAALEQAQRLLRINPAEFIRKFAPDFDLGEAAKQLWYAKLGDAAPADQRAQMDARAAKSEIEQLRTEVATNQQRLIEDFQRQQTEAAYHQYVGSLGSFAKAVPDEYPLVKAFAKDNPERVQQGLLKIAQNHAQATNGQVITATEAAAKLNSELEALRKTLVPDAVTPPAPPSTSTPATLRNKHTTVQPSRTVPDLADEDAKFQAALEAVKAVGGSA